MLYIAPLSKEEAMATQEQQITAAMENYAEQRVFPVESVNDASSVMEAADRLIAAAEDFEALMRAEDEGMIAA